MARYISGEPMYQCKTGDCKAWFSDREGIKIAVGGRDIKTHIGCPKCKHKWTLGGHAVQVRHGYEPYGETGEVLTWVNNNGTSVTRIEV